MLKWILCKVTKIRSLQELKDVQNLPRHMLLCCKLWFRWRERWPSQWDCPLLLWRGRLEEGQFARRDISREQISQTSCHWWIPSPVDTNCFIIHLLPTCVSIIEQQNLFFGSYNHQAILASVGDFARWILNCKSVNSLHIFRLILLLLIRKGLLRVVILLRKLVRIISENHAGGAGGDTLRRDKEYLRYLSPTRLTSFKCVIDSVFYRTF